MFPLVAYALLLHVSNSLLIPRINQMMNVLAYCLKVKKNKQNVHAHCLKVKKNKQHVRAYCLKVKKSKENVYARPLPES